MESLGNKIHTARKKKEWTAKTFIVKLGIDLSTSYITQIELHGAVPAPEVVCRIAEVLGLDKKDLLKLAMESKKSTFSKLLDKKYERAVSKSF
jgi:transcriptional regulator with XRE-family HTH domain